MSRELDPSDARLRPLAEYADILPSSHRGKRLHRATLWRWCLQGLHGGRVRLRTVLLGGGRMCCDRWVAQFIDELSTAANSATDPPAGLPDERLAAIAERFS